MDLNNIIVIEEYFILFLAQPDIVNWPNFELELKLTFDPSQSRWLELTNLTLSELEPNSNLVHYVLQPCFNIMEVHVAKIQVFYMDIGLRD